MTRPHRFVVFTDREYAFAEGVEQRRLSTESPTWACMIEPFQIDGPLIVTGLDTVIVGNIDELADYCDAADRIALPRSPGKDYACNAIALVPAGKTGIYSGWSGENDMDWLRAQPHAFIDDMFPGWVQSYKCDVRPNGLGEARVVYMHGRPKQSELMHLNWVKENW